MAFLLLRRYIRNDDVKGVGLADQELRNLGWVFVDAGSCFTEPKSNYEVVLNLLLGLAEFFGEDHEIAGCCNILNLLGVLFDFMDV